ncbi:hypothetical protein ScPMuIL_014570 [Solemya velum]
MDKKFTPVIDRYVKTLLTDGGLGICEGKIKVSDITSSCPSLKKQQKSDRFKIIIPYAGQSLMWEVLFDCNHPEDPPDFIFGADDNEFSPSLEDLKCLSEWDANDPRALLLAVEQLVSQYGHYQQQLVENNDRLRFEYSSLIDQTELTPEDIEVLIHRSETKLGPVHFLIKLNVDFSGIPTYLTNDNPGKDLALLLITSPSPDSNRVAPQLFLSPRVEQAFGGSANLRIPSYPNGSYLIDYVPSVLQLLKNKVEQVVQGHEKREEYIAAFLSHFGKSVLEYDAESFSKISFLFEWNDFFFIVHIDLPLYFPKESPVISLQSVYHESQGKPYMEIIKEYPYSPRWTGNEMADRTRGFILSIISTFQKSSVLAGSS